LGSAACTDAIKGKGRQHRYGCAGGHPAKVLVKCEVHTFSLVEVSPGNESYGVKDEHDGPGFFSKA